MRKWVMHGVQLIGCLALLGPALPAPVTVVPGSLYTPLTQATGVSNPSTDFSLLRLQQTESGLYIEDFTAYTAKDYTADTVWDPWAHMLRLARPDAVTQTSPVVAVDGADHSVIVWSDYRNGSYDVYAQRLDANGNQLWATDLRVNSDTGTTDQWNPAVVVDGSGNALVVWNDNRNGNADIYVQKLAVDGNRLWATDVRVNSDTGTAAQENPAVAVDGGGNAIVVWMDHRNSNYDLYVQKLGTDGDRLWAADVQISPDTGTTYKWYPAVVVDGSGNAVVVWQDDRQGNADIYAQRLAPSGNQLWAADVRVSAATGMVAWQTYPAVAVNRNGTIVVVWQDDRNDNYDIYAQQLAADGNRLWGADTRVNSDTGTAYQSFPVVVVDGSDNVVVIWEDYRNGNADIYAQKIGASGNRLWAADTHINSDSEAAAQRFPAAAMDGSGDAVVVWADDRNDSCVDIYAQEIKASGSGLWSVDVRVNSDSGTATQGHPAVVLDENGNAIVVWEDDRNGPADIYARRLDSSGNSLWTAAVRINSDRGAAVQGLPAVAADRSGNVVVVWHDFRNGNWDIYAQKLDVGGNRLWPSDLRVNSDAGMAYQLNPVVAVDGSGHIVVAWEDDRNGNADIYAQRLDADGDRLWATDVCVHSDAGTVYQLNPVVAVSRSGNAVVVWEDGRHGNADIYAQQLDANGNWLWGTDLRVNSDTGTDSQGAPVVAVDGSGNAVVVWHDSRNGNDDIYTQRVDTSGHRLWATDVRVNSDAETATQWYPAVAVDGGDNAVVVWDDYRNGNYDIYAQKVNASGSRLWSLDVRVNSDSGTANQYSPAVAVDGSDNAVVAWQDRRNSNADIYAQKINQVGGKGWLADLQVVYPDSFYFPAGTVQSRVVDTLTGNIAAATLTADYQTNGGAVQFYLTNDSGIHWMTAMPGVATVFTTTGSDLRWRAVLTGDPIWRHRTPVVSSLWIEYSTEISYADAYEPDDVCAQARPIAINGATQAHTFHQQGDADWVWFDVVTNTTYIIQTSNTQANADTQLDLYPACLQPPLDSDDNIFGREARITWQATFAGRVYARAANHSSTIYGLDTGYDLAVRTFSQPPVAVIVGGHNDSYQLQANIDQVADTAYRTFIHAGVPKANIRYFSPNPARDVDDNGLQDDIYATATITGVRVAIQDWSHTQGVALGVPFYVVLVDHGYYDQFLVAGSGGKILAQDLDLWLSNLEATSGADNLNVIIEACHSGSFIDITSLGPAEISGRNRVVIASTASGLNAYPSAQGAYFSDAFWTAVGGNQDLWTAFVAGRQAVAATGLSQVPWLDDNGDAVADAQDGALARGRGLGGVFVGSPPVIDRARIGALHNGQATVQAQVRDDFGVRRVWAVIYPPDFVEPPPSQDGTTPVANVPTATLTLMGSELYGVTYSGFTQGGAYRVVVYAVDDEGNWALPVTVMSGYVVYLPLVLRNR